MRKLGILFLLGVILLTPRFSYAISFPILDALITPLPVFDAGTFGGLTSSYMQQIEEAIKAHKQKLEKMKEQLKLFMNELDLSSSPLQRYLVNQPKTAQSGSETPIDAFKATGKENIDGGAISDTNVDLTNAASLEQAIEPILVSQAVGSIEENLKKIQRKQYEQQNVIDVLAKTLYYKKELEDLQKTMSQISAASSTSDSAGAVAVPAEFMAVKNKIKALQMKITATRQSLKGMQGQMSAEPLKEPIVSKL